MIDGSRMCYRVLKCVELLDYNNLPKEGEGYNQQIPHLTI